MNKKIKKNNIVLITGASGHIGSAIACLLYTSDAADD